MTIRVSRGFLAITVILVTALVISACGVFSSDDDSSHDLAKVLEAYEKLQENYVDRELLDPEVLSEAAIRGMLSALDDPFTTYFDPRGFEAAVGDIQGEFTGIGAEVTVRDDKPTVVAPIPGTPAEAAGLRAGDVFVEVDGRSLEGLSLDDVIFLIRGPKGEPVILKIFRASTDETFDVTIIRDTIRTVTVRTERLDNGIVRVRISQFAGRTGEELEAALKELNEEGVRAIVLDLRNNPGGLLDVVVDVASEFLEGGLVLYEIDGLGERRDWEAGSGGQNIDTPMVVLVNGGSASGSEVVAGAMQARGRATVIGTQTFGKGVVNLPIPLKDGSGIYVTIARWFTPTGDQIGDIGITPDIIFEQSEDAVTAGQDPQLEKAIEVVEAEIRGLIAATNVEAIVDGG